MNFPYLDVKLDRGRTVYVDYSYHYEEHKQDNYTMHKEDNYTMDSNANNTGESGD